MNKIHQVAAPFSLIFVLALAGSILSLSGCDDQASKTDDATKAGASITAKAPDKETVPAAAFSGIQVSFKMDPRITRGLYMGDRWISPPTYMSANAQDAIEAKAYGIDGKGKSMKISPQWITGDTEMVTVVPAEGHEVRIIVKHAGESSLKVTSEGLSRELSIKAAEKGKTIQVEITQPETPLPAKTFAPVVSSAFKSRAEKFGYALGMNLGNGVRKQSIEADTDLMIQGMKDALSGSQTLLTEEETRAVLFDLQKELKSKQSALQGENKTQIAEKNSKEGGTFLADNKTRNGVVTLDSGLQYKILKTGKGTKPRIDDTVVCHYRGTLIDGTEFDSSYRRNRPSTFALRRVIKGWTEALQLMPVSSKWLLFIPASLAYGTHGARGIGPNATLIFEVELIAIQGKS